mmetsp:Transcript_14409/g.34870  ORF Transcript_14409/g.34870 Transcript_14409/m.34870 type:complete len:251 (-) Transcript_14409:396-1148(-)|eukprot:CAMPEP_0113501894 /NCGR_PEP_ID=MMETSP0014_2-20120614/33220_1 /TAXON_ID=2857 /ORGANISM="Nitzschia sp." /LENGTH=250 /DNA_ID=CAMNT_0000396557 /DNA_START=329 /DNA_END=1081 /DNA_ORIENTATION=+ /assembly_acc=CAM_ASM_000159
MPGTKQDDCDAASAESRRRIIEEELKKSQEEARLKREQKMKSLVGQEAPHVNERKTEIRHHQQQYAIKGREHLLLLDADGNPLPFSLEEQRSPVKSPVKSPSSGTTSPNGSNVSPLKKYKEIANRNALTSTINSPSLFGGNNDPLKARQLEVEQMEAERLKNKVDPRDETSLIPDGWYSGPHFYTLVEVRQRQVPEINNTNANPSQYKNRREEFLSSEEFQKAFNGLTKLEYVKQPKWKRDKLKQSLYLF